MPGSVQMCTFQTIVFVINLVEVRGQLDKYESRRETRTTVVGKGEQLYKKRAASSKHGKREYDTARDFFDLRTRSYCVHSSIGGRHRADGSQIRVQNKRGIWRWDTSCATCT